MSRGLRYLGISATVGAAATAALAAVRSRAPEDWPPAPGDFVEVGGERIHHLVERGGRGPTVVFESALSCPCTEWAWVLRALKGTASCLAYDRPGNGWSSQRNPPITAAEVNDLTVALLRKLDMSGPYVLVGHSVGGLLARTFAGRHADELAGIVLVDSSHPDQLERSALQREGMPLVKQGISTMYWRARLRILGDDDGFGAISELPGELVEPSGRVMRRPEPWAAARREFGLWHTRWAAEAHAVTPAPTLPVGVVTAGQQASMDLAHGRMQAELAGLTQVGRHEVVRTAEHDSLVMREELATHVIDLVRWARECHAESLRSRP
ncbi:Pimeloyl-ACP methyl ester carboxylesterase [Amycolatopsis marina]|uniref:Pimeloyl-ACP methyl ester carboxylesterase n=1 Tax=Amycolatopsis marina TaxID=490629 RepID=A0A1I1BHE2_9PSEU|nr:alpha/beta hydrolase [Amycolatopsis marina]SFB47920.1 Pimeloyl-ACP methyl ester carboxylesterase [Amycolatopsis marina]